MIKRSAKLTLGILLILLGIMVLPLPIPLGLLSILIGLSILVSVVPAIRQWLMAARRRYRDTSSALERIKHRMPAFVRQLIDETNPDTNK
jgi:flagellar biosynthesis component FlhA